MGSVYYLPLTRTANFEFQRFTTGAFTINNKHDIKNTTNTFIVTNNHTVSDVFRKL